MSAIITCIATSVTWCFCSATASLLGACCGNDKPNSVAPGPHSGRKRSCLLLAASIVLQLAFQYGLSRLFFIDNIVTSKIPYIFNAWLDACRRQDFETTIALQESCVGHHAHYRVAFATTVFFLFAAAAAVCHPPANRVAWPAKYALWFFFVVALVFVPSAPLLSDVYLWMARVGGAGFILLQQIVIVDMAANWNESWVEKSNQAETETIGNRWLGAILISAGTLFAFSLAMIVWMLVSFTGCTSNNVFIALTLILIIVATIAQMSGEEGSLLSSACVAAWAAVLCYSAVSKNPNGACNPGESTFLTVGFGIVVTIISLLWTSYSYTAGDVLSSGNNDDDDEAGGVTTAQTNDVEEGPQQGRRVGGVVTGGAAAEEEEEPKEDTAVPTDTRPGTWKLNLALAVICCWSAMVLTHWGETKADGLSANPAVGRVSMWVIMGSQWLVLSLYIWTLVAPRLLPDRDFS